MVSKFIVLWNKISNYFNHHKIGVGFYFLIILLALILFYFYGWNIKKELSFGIFTLESPVKQELVSPSFDYKFSFYDLDGNLLPKEKVGVQLTSVSKVNFLLTVKNTNHRPIEVRLTSTQVMVGGTILNINSDSTLFRVEPNDSEIFSVFDMGALKLLRLLEEKDDLVMSFILPMEYKTVKSDNFVSYSLGVVCRNALDHIPEVEWRKLPTFLPVCFFTSPN